VLYYHLRYLLSNGFFESDFLFFPKVISCGCACYDVIIKLRLMILTRRMYVVKSDNKNLPYAKADLVKFIILLALIVVSIIVTVYYFPFFMSLREAAVRAQWIVKIKDSGVKGLAIALGIQITQVVLAAIPGEPVEIAAGFLYGAWGGLTLCLLGIFIGSLIIFMLVKFLGASFVRSIIKDKNIDKLKFLHNAESLDIVVFILFFIPGTPKDLLTYFVPLTPMKPVRFLLIATFARIPSVITSTIIGASLKNKDWVLSIIIFVLTAIMGLAGIQINNWYMKKHQKPE